MRTCNDVLDLDSDNVKALFRRGVLYGKQKEFAAALVDLKKAIKLDNGNKPARKEFARIKAIVQKRKQADKKKYGGAFAKVAKQDERRRRRDVAAAEAAAKQAEEAAAKPAQDEEAAVTQAAKAGSLPAHEEYMKVVAPGQS